MPKVKLSKEAWERIWVDFESAYHIAIPYSLDPIVLERLKALIKVVINKEVERCRKP